MPHCRLACLVAGLSAIVLVVTFALSPIVALHLSTHEVPSGSGTEEERPDHAPTEAAADAEEHGGGTATNDGIVSMRRNRIFKKAIPHPLVEEEPVHVLGTADLDRLFSSIMPDHVSASIHDYDKGVAFVISDENASKITNAEALGLINCLKITALAEAEEKKLSKMKKRRRGFRRTRTVATNAPSVAPAASATSSFIEINGRVRGGAEQPVLPEADGVVTSLSIETGATMSTIAPEPAKKALKSSASHEISLLRHRKMSGEDVDHKKFGSSFAEHVKAIVLTDSEKSMSMKNRSSAPTCLNKFMTVNSIKYEVAVANMRVLIGIGGSREHPEYISVFKLNNSFMIVTHQQARVSPDIADIAQVLKGLGV